MLVYCTCAALLLIYSHGQSCDPKGTSEVENTSFTPSGTLWSGIFLSHFLLCCILKRKYLTDRWQKFEESTIKGVAVNSCRPSLAASYSTQANYKNVPFLGMLALQIAGMQGTAQSFSFRFVIVIIIVHFVAFYPSTGRMQRAKARRWLIPAFLLSREAKTFWWTHLPSCNTEVFFIWSSKNAHIFWMQVFYFYELTNI